MKIAEPVVVSMGDHCCVCAGICHHIGPIRLCSDHLTLCSDHLTINQKESR